MKPQRKLEEATKTVAHWAHEVRHSPSAGDRLIARDYWQYWRGKLDAYKEWVTAETRRPRKRSKPCLELLLPSEECAKELGLPSEGWKQPS